MDEVIIYNDSTGHENGRFVANPSKPRDRKVRRIEGISGENGGVQYVIYLNNAKILRGSDSKDLSIVEWIEKTEKTLAALRKKLADHGVILQSHSRVLNTAEKTENALRVARAREKQRCTQ